eukprot:89752-Chlamydomonas_euryale.AAC.1
MHANSQREHNTPNTPAAVAAPSPPDSCEHVLAPSCAPAQNLPPLRHCPAAAAAIQGHLTYLLFFAFFARAWKAPCTPAREWATTAGPAFAPPLAHPRSLESARLRACNAVPRTCLHVDRNTMVLACRCALTKLHTTSIFSDRSTTAYAWSSLSGVAWSACSCTARYSGSDRLSRARLCGVGAKGGKGGKEDGRTGSAAPGSR